jgi:hypothetical protein
VIASITLLIIAGLSTFWVGYVHVHALRTGELWGRGANTYRAKTPIRFWLEFGVGVIGVAMMAIIFLLALSELLSLTSG